MLNASSLRKRLTHECCINEAVTQSHVGKSVVSLLSIPTMSEGQDPITTMSTTLQPKVMVGKVYRTSNVRVRVQVFNLV